MSLYSKPWNVKNTSEVAPTLWSQQPLSGWVDGLVVFGILRRVRFGVFGLIVQGILLIKNDTGNRKPALNPAPAPNFLFAPAPAPAPKSTFQPAPAPAPGTWHRHRHQVDFKTAVQKSKIDRHRDFNPAPEPAPAPAPGTGTFGVCCTYTIHNAH